MVGKRLTLSLVFLGVISLRAEDAPHKPPFVITALKSIQPDHTLRVENLGTPCFAVQFKMKDPFVPELERAVIYLFDDQNKLIHTLSETNPHAFPSRTEKKQKGITMDFPNVIASPEDLKFDTIYTLIFRHMLPAPEAREVHAQKTEFKWKYAIAVIGAEEQYVYKVLPAWKKVEELEFPEKKSGIEN